MALAWFSGVQFVQGQGNPIWEFPGDAAGDSCGYAVAGAGDVNGDGVPDVIVGCPDADPGGLVYAGQAKVMSGADGSLLYVFEGSGAGEHCGWAVAGAGDVNGDGVPDLVDSSPTYPAGYPGHYGRVRVFSGADGSQIHDLVGNPATNWQFGHAVAGVGDIDGDGKADLAIGDYGEWVGCCPLGEGVVRVFSGASASLLFLLWQPGNGNFGRSISEVGDVNGDAVPDIVVGAPADGSNGNGGPSYAHVFSGATGALLYTWSGASGFNGARFGWSVSGGGDMNGDAVPDVVIGSPTSNPFYSGTVDVRSGASGVLLDRIYGEGAYVELGRSVAVLGDVDGDGNADFAAGAPWFTNGQGQGRTYVYSGATGALLQRFTGAAANDLVGSSVAQVGDVNGDTVPDLLSGAPWVDPGGLADAGAAWVHAGAGVTPGVTTVGSGCAGSGGFAPIITTLGGAATPGNSLFAFALSRGRGGAPFFLFLGQFPDPIGIPVGGCYLHLGGFLLWVPPSGSLTGPIDTAGAGYGVQGIPVPSDPSLVGGTLPFQWATLDPGSPNGLFTTSGAVSVTIL